MANRRGMMVASWLGLLFAVAALGSVSIAGAAEASPVPFTDDDVKACDNIHGLSHKEVTRVRNAIASQPVALFGWSQCSCTNTAKRRFESEKVCVMSEIFESSHTPLFEFLQCIYGYGHHSFVFFNGQFYDNGFAMSESRLSSDQLAKTLVKTCADISYPACDGKVKDLRDDCKEQQKAGHCIPSSAVARDCRVTCGFCKACEDESKFCAAWAQEGHCRLNTYEGYMAANCSMSCGTCALGQNDEFDCNAGLPKWKIGWSKRKKRWCCEHRQLGCVDKFDCDAGFSNWEKDWSDAKQKWCCDHKQKGCALDFDCNAGLAKAATGWSELKKDWCCKKEAKGCAHAPVEGCTQFIISSVQVNAGTSAASPGAAMTIANLTYPNVGRVGEKAVDLVVSGQKGHVWKSSFDKDAMPDGIGMLNTVTDGKHPFEFCFVQAGTTTPVEVPAFQFNIFDIDAVDDPHAGARGPEVVTLDGFHKYALPAHRSFAANEQGKTLILTSAGDGSSTNPDDEDLTKGQKRVSARIFYKERSCFSVTFEIQVKEDRSRNWFFSLESPAMSPTTTTSTTWLLSDFHLLWVAENKDGALVKNLTYARVGEVRGVPVDLQLVPLRGSAWESAPGKSTVSGGIAKVSGVAGAVYHYEFCVVRHGTSTPVVPPPSFAFNILDIDGSEVITIKKLTDHILPHQKEYKSEIVDGKYAVFTAGKVGGPENDPKGKLTPEQRRLAAQVRFKDTPCFALTFDVSATKAGTKPQCRDFFFSLEKVPSKVPASPPVVIDIVPLLQEDTQPNGAAGQKASVVTSVYDATVHVEANSFVPSTASPPQTIDIVPLVQVDTQPNGAAGQTASVLPNAYDATVRVEANAPRFGLAGASTVGFAAACLGVVSVATAAMRFVHAPRGDRRSVHAELVIDSGEEAWTGLVVSESTAMTSAFPDESQVLIP